MRLQHTGRAILRAVIAAAVLASCAGVAVALDIHPAAAAVTQQQAIVNAAASQAGVPYCEGGGGIDGPTVGNASSTCNPGVKGYDCMSLAQYAVYQGTGATVPLPPASLPGTGTFIPPNGEDTSAIQP
jgi:cell wall-associated NlpC family hydrolase